MEQIFCFIGTVTYSVLFSICVCGDTEIWASGHSVKEVKTIAKLKSPALKVVVVIFEMWLLMTGFHYHDLQTHCNWKELVQVYCKSTCIGEVVDIYRGLTVHIYTCIYLNMMWCYKTL